MERMYWTHPDVFEAEVQVTTVEPGKVTIDPILFHPDEGGQPADKGVIGDAVVSDIRVVGGEVVHTLDRALSDGLHLARVDKEHRLCTAAQHTAQHILSGIAAKQFGLETVGVHIGLEGSTVDFHEKLGWDIAIDLERRAMDVVMQGIPVETVLNAGDSQVRSRFGKIEGDVIRIVKIGQYDASACCGAHVPTTGRIGVIRIFDIESKKAGARVSFLAGKKALERSQAETSVLRDLRGLAGCSTAELPSALQKAVERSKELTKELGHVWSLRLADLAKAAEIATIGSQRVGIHAAELPRESAPTLAAMIAEATQGAGIVLSDTYIAISSTTLSASDLLKRIQSHCGGKGGGSPKAASGRLDKTLTAQEVVEILEIPAPDSDVK
jgi:alanyl-tRNA synthetase